MVNVFDDVTTIGKDFYPASEAAWDRVVCPDCGPVQVGRVAACSPPFAAQIHWFRCTSCGLGMVRNGKTLAPAGMPLSTPAGIPEQERRVWEEARACLGVGAYSAAVLLCRKLLLHAAVGEALPAKKDNGWAPSFKECLDHLHKQGIVSGSMLPWVERIKDVGNEATHELDPVSEASAMDVARFTEQFLKLTYEMKAIMEAGAQKAIEP